MTVNAGENRGLQPGDSAAIDSLARELAVALADPVLRRQVHEDLRDSPFPRHRLHLSSYLGGERGQKLAIVAAQRGRISASRIAAIVSIRGGLQLSLPRAYDRMWWLTTERIAVEGTALTIGERKTAEGRLAAGGAAPSSAVAYTGEGNALPHSLLTESSYAFLSIAPAQIDFGLLPEQRRNAAPQHSRTTVSTFDEEIQIYKERGDSIVRAAKQSGPQPLFDLLPCEECTGGGSGSGRPMGVAIPSGKTYAQCYQPGAFDSSVDRDQDGVDDGCEAELAIAFRPQLVFDIYDCEVRRQPHFAARHKYSPDWGGVILLFYALSYRYDCGSLAHRGDSEWIILEVGPSLNSSYAPWSLKYGTLSAHWTAPNDNTAGYEASDLEDADGSPGFGAPRVWVSKGKHANYRTQTVCNTSGFWWNWDSCEAPHQLFFTLDFTGAHNLGSLGVQFLGGANSPVYDRLDNSGLYEYYWRPDWDYFCGWIVSGDNGSCAGGYRASLQGYGF